jgi:hypothetical protein
MLLRSAQMKNELRQLNKTIREELKFYLGLSDIVYELQLIDFIVEQEAAKLVASAKNISEMRGDAYVGNFTGACQQSIAGKEDILPADKYN